MKHAVLGIVLFAAGAAVGTGLATYQAARGGTDAAPRRFQLQAWEGCRALDAGDAFTAPAHRTLTLSTGRRMDVALVPVDRDNGARVFDALVRTGSGSSRSQLGFESLLTTDGVLLRVSDADAAAREVSGAAAYIHAPHPMAD